MPDGTNGQVHPPRELDHFQRAAAAVEDLRHLAGNGPTSSLAAAQGEVSFAVAHELARLSALLERAEHRERAKAKAEAQRRRFPRLLKGRFT